MPRNPPAPGYAHVRVPDFARHDDAGRLASLRCKLCGTVIGEVTTKIIRRYVQNDGRTIEQVETRFRRNSMYAEVLVDMDTPKGVTERHGTCGCKKCFAGKLKPAVLHELVRCDYEEQQYPQASMEQHTERTVKGSLLLDTRKLGLS